MTWGHSITWLSHNLDNYFLLMDAELDFIYCMKLKLRWISLHVHFCEYISHFSIFPSLDIFLEVEFECKRYAERLYQFTFLPQCIRMSISLSSSYNGIIIFLNFYHLPDKRWHFVLLVFLWLLARLNIFCVFIDHFIIFFCKVPV